jgi:hypothetical protein
MLPVTSPLVPEILPSVTVSVERAEGSQLPLFVTTVTSHRPSYGFWAKAGAAARTAAEARKTVAMRLRRMNQIPVACDEGVIPGQCVETLPRRDSAKRS